MEIAYGFSRFGRYALDISEVLEIFGSQSACDLSTVESAAKTTMEMIRMSIDSFTNRDVELAKQIAPLDDYVDDKYRSPRLTYRKRSKSQQVPVSRRC